MSLASKNMTQVSVSVTDFLPLFFVPYGTAREVILVDVVDGANDVMPNGP